MNFTTTAPTAATAAVMAMIMNETNLTTIIPSMTPSLAPTTAPNNATTWQCTPSQYSDGYYCYELDDSLPAPAIRIFECQWDNVTKPNVQVCDELCAIVVPQDGGGYMSCESCGLLPSGSVAYDCTNIFGQQDVCAARNGQGTCGPYVHWECSMQRGFGRFCHQSNSYRPANDSPLPTELPVRPGVYCPESITGLSIDACIADTMAIQKQGDNNRGPPCYLSSTSSEVSGLCDSCTLLPSGDFSFDCSNILPNTTCPARHANGTCYAGGQETNTPVSFDIAIAFAQSTGNKAGDDDDCSSCWILEIFTDTGFNVLSDVVALLVGVLFAFALEFLYGPLASWHIRRGSGMPINSVAQVPHDIGQAFQMLTSWKSTQGLLLFTFIMLADLSHSIADTGLDFVSVPQKSYADHVLVAGGQPTKRNRALPFEMAGDPLLSRTASIIQGDDNILTRQQSSILLNYMAAVELVVRGASPFSSMAPNVTRIGASWGGLPFFNAYFGSGTDDFAPLNELDLEIPLNCEKLDVMRNFTQAEGENFHFGTVPTANVSLPACDFSRARTSGIYEGASGTIQILEYVEMPVLPPIVNGAFDQGVSLIRNGTDNFQTFLATPDDKRLARDRENWKEGRIFVGIDGLQVGNLTIPFGRVVLATGGESRSFPVNDRTVPIEWNRRSEYGLLAEVEGACPQRPSGRSVRETACLAVLTMECETFKEDYVSQYDQVFYPIIQDTICSLERIGFVWGRNFVADAELVSVAAGLYGIIRPVVWNFSHRTFLEFCIPAAVFAMGVIEKRASVESIVRPRINGTYIAFMVLPFAFAVIAFVLGVALQKQSLLLPRNNWEIMIAAKECDQLHARRDKREKFPEVDPSCMMTYSGDGGEHDKTSIAISRSSMFTTDAIKEAPVDDGGDDNEDVNLLDDTPTNLERAMVPQPVAAEAQSNPPADEVGIP